MHPDLSAKFALGVFMKRSKRVVIRLSKKLHSCPTTKLFERSKRSRRVLAHLLIGGACEGKCAGKALTHCVKNAI
jgi:hypothetical protein